MKVRLAMMVAGSLLLAGCYRPFPLDIVAREGRVTFWTEWSWRWFLVPQRPKAQLCSIEVWTGREWVWRVGAPLDECVPDAFPVAYGSKVPGLKLLVPPKPLRPDTLYQVRVQSWGLALATFRIDRNGRLVADEGDWELNPEERAFQERREGRLRELRAEGMTDEEAEQRWQTEFDADVSNAKAALGQ